jgi:hypothetical protein
VFTQGTQEFRTFLKISIFPVDCNRHSFHMEIAAGVIGLVRVTAAASVQTRKLCENWKDAPRDVHHLRDELETCEAFFRALRSGIVEWPLGGLEAEVGSISSTEGPAAAIGELGRLLSRSNGILETLREMLEELARGRDASSGTAAHGGCGRRGYPIAAKEEKDSKLRRVDEVGKLRKMLRRSIRDIGLFLTLLNV